MNRLRHLALTLVLAAAGALGLSSSAGAATGMEIAVQDDFALVTQAYRGADREESLALSDQFHSTWVRANVYWAAANGKQSKSKKKPSTPTYDFTAYDQLLLAARAHGQQLELTLSGPAPAWGSGNKKMGVYKPNAKLFGEFVRAVVTHFGDNVNRYSVWNEPNLAPWLQPLKSAPSLYRSLYRVAYSEIKKANPDAQVLIGETSPYGTKGRSLPPIDFLRGVLKGGALKADGYAHHPYDFQHAPNYKWPGRTNATLGTLSNLIKELDRQASAGRLETPSGDALDVYLTEYGYLRSGRYKLSESKRGDYLQQAYDIALKNPRVRQMLQYLLIQPTKKYQFFDMSLASTSGKPFGAAFTALVDWTTTNATKINGAGG
jgi:GH35 family endo-1,4-beta-xylanase